MHVFIVELYANDGSAIPEKQSVHLLRDLCIEFPHTCKEPL